MPPGLIVGSTQKQPLLFPQNESGSTISGKILGKQCVMGVRFYRKGRKWRFASFRQKGNSLLFMDKGFKYKILPPQGLQTLSGVKTNFKN